MDTPKPAAPAAPAPVAAPLAPPAVKDAPGALPPVQVDPAAGAEPLHPSGRDPAATVTEVKPSLDPNKPDPAASDHDPGASTVGGAPAAARLAGPGAMQFRDHNLRLPQEVHAAAHAPVTGIVPRPRERGATVAGGQATPGEPPLPAYRRPTGEGL